MLQMNRAPDTDHRCLMCPKFAEKLPSSTIFSDAYSVEIKEVLFYQSHNWKMAAFTCKKHPFLIEHTMDTRSLGRGDRAEPSTRHLNRKDSNYNLQHEKAPFFRAAGSPTLMAEQREGRCFYTGLAPRPKQGCCAMGAEFSALAKRRLYGMCVKNAFFDLQREII